MEQRDVTIKVKFNLHFQLTLESNKYEPGYSKISVLNSSYIASLWIMHNVKQ